MFTGIVVFQNTTLGGRLYHTQDLSSQKDTDEYKQKEEVKKSANASLGIPEVIEVKGDASSKTGDAINDGAIESKFEENLLWSGIGGNPGLSVE